MDVTEQPPTPPSTPTWTPEAAYHQTLPEMAALPAAELLIVNLDIPMTIASILATLPVLQTVQADMATRWLHPGVVQVDRLERYAWALQHTHFLFLASRVAPRPDAGGVAQDLKAAHRHLLACLRGLVLAGVLESELVEPYGRAKSHRALVRSSFGLVTLCQTNWSRMAGKTVLSTAELERVLGLITELSVLLGSRRRRPAPLTRAVRERQQAFTLLMREYSELRRAAQFLYRGREADRRVPSLFRKGARAQRRNGVLTGALSA